MLKDGVGGGTCLDGAAGVELSPDGAFAYVAAVGRTTRCRSSAATPRRATLLNFGKLTYHSERHEGEASGLGGAASGLDGARQAVVSPDGQHLYVASEESDAVVVFQRNPRHRQPQVPRGAPRRGGLAPASSRPPASSTAWTERGALAVDPDRRQPLRRGAETDSALSVFVRAGAPPSFAFTGGQPGSNPPAPVTNGVGGVSGLKAVTDVAVAGRTSTP